MSTLWRVWLRRGQDEQGFTIVEVVVALVIFGLVITGIAASSSSGLRLVTKSNGRQTATQLVVQEMELLRSTPYSSLGLPGALSHSADPNHPDNAVSASGTSYTVPDTGTTEPLTIFTGGSTAHGPEAASRNGFDFELFRYVTWLDDPVSTTSTEDFKRVTIVVRWKADAGSPKPNSFATSSLFSAGSVGWVFPTSSSTSSTTVIPPTTTTTLSTAPPPNCVHTDIQPPSGTIVILAGTGAGTGYTSQNSVALQLTASDDCSRVSDLTMLLSNDGVTFSEFAFSSSYTWALVPPGNGNHTVYVKYKDQIGNLSGVGTATIRVDSTKPSTPSAFTATRPNGNNRPTTLSWGTSTDNDTLVGYRVYKQVGTAAFTLLTTVDSPCSPSPCGYVDNDTPSNSNPKYTFYVVSYDAAGNESSATTSITVN